MKRTILSLCISALLFSCSSDDDNQILKIQEDNFYALKVGNSWVYKNYRYNNATDDYVDSGVIDNVSIISTQVINGEKYFEFKTITSGNINNSPLNGNLNGEQYELLRDSLGYLVSDTGFIKYTNNDYSERVVQTYDYATLYNRLNPGTTTVNTEAGTFECLDMELYGVSPIYGPYPSRDHYNYADGIGLVFNTISYISSSEHIMERRLDSYNIE